MVADTQRHELRHENASHAVIYGACQHVVAGLHRHRRTSTTSRFVDPDAATLSQAPGRMALTVKQRLLH